MSSRNAQLREIHDAVSGGDPFTSTEQAALLTEVGSVFTIKKTVVSSAILSASAVDLTGVSTVGELALESVLLKTDTTGLGTSTGVDVQILTNNVKGAATVMEETIANLGASVTLPGTEATVAEFQPTVLETGKKVQIQATTGPCTGAGTVDVYLTFRRLTAGATIAAA